ncbi:arabinose-5-phosphate isomerase [Faunimonas pinastri]|uniref:Arabinose-5-phosphate isomerase n=1 Tax=Faunimonas pinastri TaxID=1855383 RepID=A0A1H9P3B7_9HYPH|nr:KpsF/GutQ family sugar-phosphate isomerase [Faunimonas pinastri]SER42682.1 arabinose-5-phosphate isomerase [Faunimonas pinastri]
MNSPAVQSALRTLGTEIDALNALNRALGNGLSEPFKEACATIRKAEGRVVVTGMGKSGHIGTKIAATLASTGTPAFFVHPAEASHGDLGMITHRDVILALSWSGETAELKNIVFYSRRFSVPLIAITAGEHSTLGQAADTVLLLPRVTEACPHGLAPTSSTLMQLALGDALAVALLESRDFTPDDFAVFHPGGSLGANLQHVRDIMHAGDSVPIAPLGTRMDEAIVLMTQKGFGCLAITGGDGRLAGIVTDGDLRRHLGGDLLSRRVEEIMNRNPRTVAPEMLVASALKALNSAAITALLVVDGGKPVGIVHMHDMLRIGAA